MSIAPKPDDLGRRAIEEAAEADAKHSEIDRLNGSTERDPIWLATHWAACLDIPSGDFIKRDLLFVAAEIRRRDATIAKLKSQLWGIAHANAIMAWNLGAEQRGTDAIAAELTAANATIARLSAELEEANTQILSQSEILSKLLGVIADVRGMLGAAGEALQPFADAAEYFEEERPGWYHRGFTWVNGDIPFGMAQLIDARAALAKLSATKGA